MLDGILNQVTANDLLTPLAKLMRADSIEQARNLLHEYDVVPSPRHGEIKEYFKKGSEKKHKLSLSELVSEKTDVIALVKLFAAKKYYFVLSQNKVIGLLHYSDLNKPICRIPVFALYQSLERILWGQIKNRISIQDLSHIFRNDEVTRFERKKREAESHNVDIGWTGIFSFPYILKLARYYGFHDCTDAEIQKLKVYRNRLAHSDHNLISKYEDIPELSELLSIIISMIGDFEF